MILEQAVLDVKPGTEGEFEAAFERVAAEPFGGRGEAIERARADRSPGSTMGTP